MREKKEVEKGQLIWWLSGGRKVKRDPVRKRLSQYLVRGRRFFGGNLRKQYRVEIEKERKQRGKEVEEERKLARLLLLFST